MRGGTATRRSKRGKGDTREDTGEKRKGETKRREAGQLLSPGLGWLGLPRGQPRLTILISCAGPPRDEIRTLLLLLLLLRLLRLLLLLLPLRLLLDIPFSIFFLPRKRTTTNAFSLSCSSGQSRFISRAN